MSKQESSIISSVPIDYQYPDLPTGCEATALSMLLRWADVKIDKFLVVDTLKKGEKVHMVDGVWYGANPNEEFVGDPYSDDSSFGVFEKPILEVVEKFLSGKGINLTGKPFNTLINYLEEGQPVMAWTTLKQQKTFHSKSWYDRSGHKIDWYRYEHAVTMVGFNEEYVFVNDPDTGKQEAYNRITFEENWISLGRRAISVAP
ncbi:C39 family peptidase [Virgibacillus halodenitrificans]|uniref:C39 family peptidase n=1 Tax=Virgibacillus halodenitrificans TaxID=1482 RepID=UPI000760D5FA|nr:C39 family peptidase [Virgibacillus halodenitrificans]MCJ0933241.1 C39 family peptidase [Virgibacillus halodenitrificans]